LNYSSLAAVFSALIFMGAVLLSTVYPARLAARTEGLDLARRNQYPVVVGPAHTIDDGSAMVVDADHHD
jgi:hypothetical protein